MSTEKVNTRLHFNRTSFYSVKNSVCEDPTHPSIPPHLHGAVRWTHMAGAECGPEHPDGSQSPPNSYSTHKLDFKSAFLSSLNFYSGNTAHLPE